MLLAANVCYRALLARDARFDGAFYVAVRTTRIYCRPVCRVKPALQKNCTFYPSAAAAEAAGFRPCLRCRPELAPGSSSMEAISRLAGLAMQEIENGALQEGSIADLADDFGVTDRHLRRVIKSELGVSPVELAQTHRLHTAKRLLTETGLPIAQIAKASGFSSVRRFNSLFKTRYRLVPGEFRKSQGPRGQQDFISCELSYRPPFAWNEMLEFLRARAVLGVEWIDNGTYNRTARIGDSFSVLSVRKVPGKDSLQVTLSTSLLPHIVSVLARLRRLFDLNAQPRLIAERLGSLAKKNPGLRVPGAFDSFEMGVRAILGQQITVKAATTLAGRFVAAFGRHIETDTTELTHLTPTPERVAEAKVSEISALGIVRKRAETIRILARSIAEKKLRLEPDLNMEHQIEVLTNLPGIGAWTAQYIAMRTLAWPDAFPHTDLGIARALGEKNPARILQMAETWRPWRSYAAMHLWKSLEETA